MIENLVQFTTSGVPVFTQRAAIAALDQGEAFLADQIERCRRSRDIVCDGLAATGRVRFFEPEATFYLFCAVDGFDDSRALALRLIDEGGGRRRARLAPSARAARAVCASASAAIRTRSPRRRGGWRAGSALNRTCGPS